MCYIQTIENETFFFESTATWNCFIPYNDEYSSYEKQEGKSFNKANQIGRSC